MIQWFVLLAVKSLKFVIVGAVAMTSSCEHRPEAPEAPTSGGALPCTGSAVMMRELGSCDLPTLERVMPARALEGYEVVTILRIETIDEA